MFPEKKWTEIYIYLYKKYLKNALPLIRTRKHSPSLVLFLWLNGNHNHCAKVSKYGVFLVRTFPYSVQIREKNGPKKTPYLNTFHVVNLCIKICSRTRTSAGGKLCVLKNGCFQILNASENYWWIMGRY